jgi:hypothetical protein
MAFGGKADDDALAWKGLAAFGAVFSADVNDMTEADVGALCPNLNMSEGAADEDEPLLEPNLKMSPAGAWEGAPKPNGLGCVDEGVEVL